MALSILVVGSTERTLICAKALALDPRFEITGVLTPVPKPIGRKQILTKNPMHQWADVNQIPIILIEKKIDSSIQELMHSQFSIVDFLLVVDFGYIVPQWLLDIPSIAPVNVHPSDLPKYRGSSPGQFVLAFGETQSVVSIMVMDAKLDHGPIITKIPFAVDPRWTTPDYYARAFTVVRERLADVIYEFSVSKMSSAQPDTSPTPTARMLTRDDGFVPNETLCSLIENCKFKIENYPQIPFLTAYHIPLSPLSLYNLWRAFTPWPGLWTTIEKNSTQKRVKLLSFHMVGDKLFLDEVSVEGKHSQRFDSSNFFCQDQ